MGVPNLVIIWQRNSCCYLCCAIWGNEYRAILAVALRYNSWILVFHYSGIHLSPNTPARSRFNFQIDFHTDFGITTDWLSGRENLRKSRSSEKHENFLHFGTSPAFSGFASKRIGKLGFRPHFVCSNTWVLLNLSNVQKKEKHIMQNFLATISKAFIVWDTLPTQTLA